MKYKAIKVLRYVKNYEFLTKHSAHMLPVLYAVPTDVRENIVSMVICKQRVMILGLA